MGRSLRFFGLYGPVGLCLTLVITIRSCKPSDMLSSMEDLIRLTSRGSAEGQIQHSTTQQG